MLNNPFDVDQAVALGATRLNKLTPPGTPMRMNDNALTRFARDFAHEASGAQDGEATEEIPTTAVDAIKKCPSCFGQYCHGINTKAYHVKLTFLLFDSEALKTT